MTPNRERTYEAIYAAAFVRAYDRATKSNIGCGADAIAYAHEGGKSMADAWLLTVGKAYKDGK